METESSINKTKEIDHEVKIEGKDTEYFSYKTVGTKATGSTRKKTEVKRQDVTILLQSPRASACFYVRLCQSKNESRYLSIFDKKKQKVKDVTKNDRK